MKKKLILTSILLMVSILIFSNMMSFANLDNEMPIRISTDNNESFYLDVLEDLNLTITDSDNKKEVIFSDFVYKNTSIKEKLFADKSYDIVAKTDNGTYVFELIFNTKKSNITASLMIKDVLDVENKKDEKSIIIVPETENNDDFIYADIIGLYDVAKGKISNINDEDFYTIRFPYNGIARVILNDIPEQKDYDLYFYDENYNLISSGNTTFQNEILIERVQKNKPYYVKVVGYNNSFSTTDSYTVSFGFTKDSDPINHYFDTAKVLPEGFEIDQEIVKIGEELFYKFTPNETDNYVIRSFGTIDVIGTLFDNNFIQMDMNDDKLGDLYGNFEIIANLKADTTYFVKVHPFEKTMGKFSLLVKKLDPDDPVPPVKPTCPEVTEDDHGDTIKTSTLVNVDSVFSGKINFTGDKDVFKFKVYENGSYMMSSILDPDYEYEVYLYNWAGNLIDKYEGKDFDMATTLTYGYYYVEVNMKDYDSCNEYKFEFNKLETPKAGYFYKQWGLLNTYTGYDINILPLWETTKGNGFKIGVANTGTYVEHQDLKGNVDSNLTYNFTHDKNDVFPTYEYYTYLSAKYGHGTHVAGGIAGLDNDYGILGVAPKNKVVPMKVLGSKIINENTYNGAVSSFINSIDYAMKNDIKIINTSFGGKSPSVSEKEAMLLAEDILFVIPAGNNNSDLDNNPEYPAQYNHENSLVVGAINMYGNKAYFSNYGGATDVFAPGESIFNLHSYNGYIYRNGTSMAVPMVSSIASLIWSEDNSLTPLEVRSKIANPSNARYVDNLNGKSTSNGIVNAYKAFNSNDNYVAPTRTDNVFGSDIKSYITMYKNNAQKNTKTEQIIVKFQPKVDINQIIREIMTNNNFDKIQEIDYIELIDAYVYEFSSIDKANDGVDIFNGYSEVMYAEPNYTREIK